MNGPAGDHSEFDHARDTRIRSGRVRRAAQALAAGGIAIVVERFGAESRAALVFGAEKATEELIACLRSQGAPLRVAMPLSHVRRLELLRDGPLEDQSPICPPVDLRAQGAWGDPGVDAATTIAALARPDSSAADFVRPGHVFPVVGQDGGILERVDIPEASIDLARIAELQPVAATCEITVSPGEVAFLRRSLESMLNLRTAVVAIEDLVAYRTARAFDAAAEARLPLAEGTFKTIGYHDPVERETHLALVMGDPEGDPPLVRIHIGCLLGEAFASSLCECDSRLRRALDQIAEEGRGVLVYLRGSPHGDALLGVPEGRHASANPKRCDAITSRELRLAVGILSHLGIERLRLIADRPRDAGDLDVHGLDVVDRVPLRTSQQGSSARAAPPGVDLMSLLPAAPGLPGKWEMTGYLLGMSEGG